MQLIVTSLGCLSFTVQNDVCLTLEDCFSVFTLNLHLIHEHDFVISQHVL